MDDDAASEPEDHESDEDYVPASPEPTQDLDDLALVDAPPDKVTEDVDTSVDGLLCEN